MYTLKQIQAVWIDKQCLISTYFIFTKIKQLSHASCKTMLQYFPFVWACMTLKEQEMTISLSLSNYLKHFNFDTIVIFQNNVCMLDKK